MAINAIGLCPIGSDLYGTKREFHDIDVAVVATDMARKQYSYGDIDLQVFPIEYLIDGAHSKNLLEVEVCLAFMYGHGMLFNHPYSTLLRNVRPDISGYADTVRRYKAGHTVPDKHSIRYDIFLRRWWDTGNADPRLTEDELKEYWDRRTIGSERSMKV